MIYKCRVCGKEFDALWPDLWTYKRGNLFLCSWSCLRRYDGKEANDMMLTEEEKRKACEMALVGESPLKYLKDCGAANPTLAWDGCRNWARKNWDINLYEALPARFGQPKKKPEPKVELVYDESIAEEYRREQEEKKANEEARMIEKPMNYDLDEMLELTKGYKTTAIKKDGIGEFYYDRQHGTIDWRNEFGEEVSLLPEDWKKLAEEIPKMLKILGVEV